MVVLLMAMAMAECLQKTGYWVAVMCDDKTEYGYHTKFANERFLGIGSHKPEYAEYMLAFLKEPHFDVLIPTSDKSAEFMSFHKEELQKITGVLIPDRQVFEMGYNKNQLDDRVQREWFSTSIYNRFGKGRRIGAKELKEFPYPDS